MDRLYSLVQPIKRYRCQNFACQWIGNFAITEAMPDMDPSPHCVPVAFVVHLALVAVEIVAVIVLSNIEPTNWMGSGDPQLGSSSDYEVPAERTVTTAESG